MRIFDFNIEDRFLQADSGERWKCLLLPDNLPEDYYIPLWAKLDSSISKIPDTPANVRCALYKKVRSYGKYIYYQYTGDVYR